MKEQAYYVNDKQGLFNDWLDSLIKSCPKSESQYILGTENSRIRVSTWFKSLLENEISNEEEFYKKVTSAKPNFFHKGNFHELRTFLALLNLKARGVIEEILPSSVYKKNEGLGIDFLCELKAQKGFRRWLPIQVKSSDGGIASSKYMLIHYSKELKSLLEQGSQQVSNYLKKIDFSSKASRDFVNINAHAKPITKIAQMIEDKIAFWDLSDKALKTEKDFNDLTRAEKLIAMMRAGILEPIRSN